MNKTKKTIITIVCIIILGILTAVYIAFSVKEDAMSIAFYDLPETVVIALSDWMDGRGISWEPLVLDASQPLDTYVKVPVHYDLLFTYDGKNMDSVASFARTAESDVLMMMPIPIRISVQTNGRLTATPLLADHFQISSNKEILAEQGASEPYAISQLEEIAKKVISEKLARSSEGQAVTSIIAAPLLCAGNDDDHLIMLVSSLLETMYGIENWEIAASILGNSVPALSHNKKDTQTELDDISSDSFSAFFNLPQVYGTLSLLADWEDQGLLSEAWLSLTTSDIASAMQKESATFIFAPLSFIRTLPQSTTKQYSSWYMPSGQPNAPSRYLTAPAVVVMQFSLVKSPLQSARQASKKAEMAHALIAELASSSAQAQLSAATGLVPLNSVAQAPDITAAETRQLFEFSDGIIPDIAQAAFVLPEERSQFAQAIRNHLSQM